MEKNGGWGGGSGRRKGALVLQIPVCIIPVPRIFPKIFLLHFSLSPPEAAVLFFEVSVG